MFFPLGDDNRGVRLKPWIGYALIACCALAWWQELRIGDAFTYAFALVPFEITHGQDLIGPMRLWVGDHPTDIPQFPGPHPVYLTLITSQFLHGSWAHLIGNMLYLWIFGDQIEDYLGRFRFVLFYLFCGVAAGLSQVLVLPDSPLPTLGASGAIAGVLGGYLAKYPGNAVRVLFFFRIIVLPASVVLGVWFLAQVLSQAGMPKGTQGGVAYMAHIGGFAAGFIWIRLLKPRAGYRGRR